MAPRHGCFPGSYQAFDSQILCRTECVWRVASLVNIPDMIVLNSTQILRNKKVSDVFTKAAVARNMRLFNILDLADEPNCRLPIPVRPPPLQ